jgi:hypothetical protein
LEVPLRARHLYGCSVDGLIQLINGRIEDKVITKLLSVTRKQCYLAVRERMNSWFDDSGNKLADGSTRAPYIMLHLPRKSDGTSHAIEEDSKNIIEYVETALKIAIQNNDVELAKFIIQMGVVNKQNFRMPPSEEMVALMLDYGLGTTLYDYTTIDYQLKSVQLLFAYGLVDMKAWLKWLCYDRNVAGVQQFVSNNGMEMLRWSELYEILYQHVWWCSRWKREQGLIIMEMILQSLSDRNDIIATANQLNSIRNEFGMTGCGSVLATMFTEYLKFSPITDDMSGAKFSLSPSSVEQFRWLHT